MPASAARPCPSCDQPMQVRDLPGQYGSRVEIDFCFGCQGLWFDSMENLKLAPEAVVTMFKAMHSHRDEPHAPLGGRLHCPECRGSLVQGFDIVRSGRYITHRCSLQHGRFSSFSSFMIEKGFVRQLTRPEIADIASKLGTINCSNCGAPVDLRKEDACSHCRSSLSLLDPAAVEKALQSYAKAPAARALPPPAVADALVAMARERARDARQQVWPSEARLTGAGLAVDLFAVGLSLVSSMWEA